MKKVNSTFKTPISKKNTHLVDMVELSVESTAVEGSPGDQHEFSLPDDLEPLSDVSNKPVVARKSSAANSLEKMMNPSWASGDKTDKRKKSPVAQVAKKTKVVSPSPGPSTSKGDTGDNLYGWRRNFGLLEVLQQVGKAMVIQKVPFEVLKFSTSVYQPLIEAGVIQVNPGMDSKKLSDASTVLKSKIKTIINKFAKESSIPARVCPLEDRPRIEEELRDILLNNKSFEGNTRASIRQYEGKIHF